MNWRKPTYLAYAAVRGYRFPRFLRYYSREHKRGAGRETTIRALAVLLRHCKESVPYYSEWLKDFHFQKTDPIACLRQLPVLNKRIIRTDSVRLRSRDLNTRKWLVNTSGGSTGEPVRLIQDREYEDRCKALGLLCQTLWGSDLGRPVVKLWGSERDIDAGTQSPKAMLFNWWTNTTWMNAFNMTPERMRGFIDVLNRRRALIMAYAQAAYELAQFAEREKISVKPQYAVVTSAGTLYPFMRDKISRVFGCPVYNLYGSREVSLIACELPGREGLWAAPWSNVIEILDDKGMPVPDGEEGNIVVTCLTNFAMPLVRYQIGDRGALMVDSPANGGHQFLKFVSGRSVDMFRTRDQKLVDGEYFTHLLYFRPWVEKFQVIQKDHEHILFKIVKVNGDPDKTELDEIASKSRLVMGNDCRIDFEFLGNLPPHPTGKYRYTISEINN